MMIETERLQLIPLTLDQLRLWVTDMAELESELGVVYDAEPMEGIFLKIVEGQCGITEKDEAHYVYHTFWFLVRREDRVVVGSADFKNVPDPEGLVEIGYGLGLKYEHKGYMTEAVGAMCRWALEQDVPVGAGAGRGARSDRGDRAGRTGLHTCTGQMRL